MKMRIIILLCLTITLLSLNGCLIPHDPLPALWFYTFSGGHSEDRDDLLTPASFLEIRADGSFTSDLGSFEYGRWSRKDQQLSLTNQEHKTLTFSLNSINHQEMQLATRKGIPLNFDSQPLPPARAAEDPFCIDNNRWRLPPARKESDPAIRNRLFNHCQFWETYFTWALNNNITTVDVRSTPTPIKIYGNGFTLKPFDELPAVWKSYFFDEEDCRKANEIIEDIFLHKNIAWAHTDNKYKMFIGAFQQLEKYLR
jgi:hypothetical protein